ncbi:MULTISPECIES: hypothetical protein [unclassified Mesorhizobium]|uniref:hypothetical protein n=1 Tax=unclassified Mesorhizobium TaxID=325217 RepID=UPI0003CEF4AE|nr:MULTISPECIES: hypothetical protein [unclassified Mesorhizobium]ESX84432.1 hypothetical protein X756_26405 [Mesorhizobium sp. LSHC412B00]ESY02850.1 hypothetical protein X752_28725 [Mesorhizobium sp. LNJC398B00]
MSGKDREWLGHLHEFLIDEIVHGKDDEPVDEAEVRAFDAAVAAGRSQLAKRKLEAARQAVRSDVFASAPISDSEMGHAKRRLTSLRTGANDDDANLTLAARFGQGGNEDDDGMLEDIAELERDRDDNSGK